LKKAKKAAVKNNNAEDKKKGLWLPLGISALFDQWCVDQSSSNEDKGLEPPVKDDDPDGKKLLSDSKPLERAWKLIKPLITLVPQNLEMWLAVFDVSLRTGLSLPS
jgi:hypothetical protein